LERFKEAVEQILTAYETSADEILMEPIKKQTVTSTEWEEAAKAIRGRRHLPSKGANRCIAQSDADCAQQGDCLRGGLVSREC
jgi:hypothetical protein